MMRTSLWGVLNYIEKFKWESVYSDNPVYINKKKQCLEFEKCL